MEKSVTPQERLKLLPFEPTVTSSNLNWSSVKLEDYKYLPPSDLSLPPLDHHIIAFHYKPPPGKLKHSAGEKSSSTTLQKNDITYVPALRDNTWQFGYGKPHCLHILLNHDFVHKVAIENFGVDTKQLIFKPQLQTTDAQMQLVSNILKKELGDKGSNGALFTESICTTLAIYLLKNYSSLDAYVVNTLPSSGLSSRQLKQIIDYMHQYMGEKVSLQSMAQQLDISSFYFAKMFRQSTGKSPYQYLKQLRLDEAKRLLQTRVDLSITDIAHKLGFADHSHFTKQFRAYTNQTPINYRKQT